MFAVTMSVTAQPAYTPTDTLTIVPADGMNYLNTFNGIEVFHESDWVLYQSGSFTGNHLAIYYDDTSVTPAIYVYYLVDELCYRQDMITNPNLLSYASWLLSSI